MWNVFSVVIVFMTGNQGILHMQNTGAGLDHVDLLTLFQIKFIPNLIFFWMFNQVMYCQLFKFCIYG